MVSGPQDFSGRSPSGADGPHVFVDDLDRPILGEADRDHLSRSLRLRPGDPFTVSDGDGRWRMCRLSDPVEPVGEIIHTPKPHPPLTVAFALTKGSKPELATQKLTELGLDSIVLFIAERSIPRWTPERERKNMARLERVAREAAMQSRRTRLPQVQGPLEFTDVAAMPGAVLADASGHDLADQSVVLVGPEGGWSDLERASLAAVRLGPGVLRAETAAIAAGAILSHRRL